MRLDCGLLGPSGVRSQVGRGGVGLGWPLGEGPGTGRPVGWADLWENGKKSIPNLIFGLTRILEIKSKKFGVKKNWLKFQKFFRIL
jgi:hypothetical protein